MARGPNVARGHRAQAHPRVRLARRSCASGGARRAPSPTGTRARSSCTCAHGFRDLPDGQIELKCPGEIEAAVYESGRRFDAWADVARLTVPVLDLHAGKGNFPRAVAERLAAGSRSIELRTLDAPHLMPMTCPDRIADDVLAWADRV